MFYIIMDFQVVRTTVNPEPTEKPKRRLPPPPPPPPPPRFPPKPAVLIPVTKEPDVAETTADVFLDITTPLPTGKLYSEYFLLVLLLFLLSISSLLNLKIYFHNNLNFSFFFFSKKFLLSPMKRL